MENKPKKQRKSSVRDEKLKAILKAAETQFAEHGFKGSTMDMIAKGAGLPKANVHYYFRTKKDLYRRVIEDICNTWLSAADEFDSDGDPATIIGHYIEIKMDLARSRPLGSRVWANEMTAGAPNIQPYLKDTVKPWLESRVAIINQWIKDGRMAATKTDSLFYLIWASTQHYADFESQIIVLNDGKPLNDKQFNESKKSLVKLILNGLGL